MIQYIQELLYQHDCVIIPGFGAFITNYQKAVIDKHQNKIAPPKKSIAFNKLLNSNDGLLINHVKEQENCSYTEAQVKVNQFVEEAKQTISKQQSLLFKNIGRFYLDHEQNWIFEPDTTTNYLLDTFGLPTLPLYPIKRLAAPSVVVQNTIQETTSSVSVNENTVEQKTNSSKGYWFTAFLALALIATIASLSINKINQQNVAWASMFDYFNNNTNIIEDNNETIANTNNIATTDETVEDIIVEEKNEAITTIENTTAPTNTETVATTVVENKAPEVTTPVVQKTDSYILIGSFLDETNALKLQQEVNANYQTVIEHKGALYRVLIATTHNNIDQYLQEIKSAVNSRAYIYCVKCNI
ncbi:MAG: hypothetical protein H6553_09400 [Chitinophagales bacterium]|nr:hypothetical protein [Chitinophagales bacterium]